MLILDIHKHSIHTLLTKTKKQNEKKMCGSFGSFIQICHREFGFVLPCGCCPCKYQVKIPFAPTSLGRLMELAKSIGHRVIVWQVTTPGAEPIDFKIEKLPEVQGPERPRNSKPLPIRNPKPTMKITKRVTTQSERTAARKLKKRQLQQEEIASKQATNIQPSLPATSKTQLKNDAAQATVGGTETLEAATKTSQQKKRPKTHFRKTKKPGRA